MTEYISVAAFIISITTGIYSWWKSRAAELKAKTTNVMDTSVQALKMLSDVTKEHGRQFILFEEAKLRFHRRTWELQDEARALGADDICDDIKQKRERILKESKEQSGRDNEIHSALLKNTQTFVVFYKDEKSDEINIRQPREREMRRIKWSAARNTSTRHQGQHCLRRPRLAEGPALGEVSLTSMTLPVRV
jgi:hypothetical protein